MRKKETITIFGLIVLWRVFLLVVAFLSTKIALLPGNFFGGGTEKYLSAPWFWGWLNFDGRHYLSIARIGYQPLTYFYFPLYPILVRFFSYLFGQSFWSFVSGGLIISNSLLVIALWGVAKIVKKDFKKLDYKSTILLLLLFPTSFYLGSFYTESLFLALAVWSFYFARTKKWFWAGLLAGVSSATRVIGLALLPALLVEAFLQFSSSRSKKIILFWPILLVPAGLMTYMLYLKQVTGDPLEFLSSVSIFGDQRSSSLILLPRVFYRYFLKILPALNYTYFPVVFTTMLEIITSIAFLALAIFSFLKIRTSYAVYLLAGYLIPTLSGSFSSLPRYVLVLFPAFLLASELIDKLSLSMKVILYTILMSGLVVSTTLFIRGFWVS